MSIVSSVENALQILDTTTFDVIISDYQMPGADGIGFLNILKEKNCSIPFILFTGRGRDEVMTEALRYRAMFYIQKGGAGDPRSRFAELDFKIRKASRRNEAGDILHETGHSVIRLATGEEIEHGQVFPVQSPVFLSSRNDVGFCRRIHPRQAYQLPPIAGHPGRIPLIIPIGTPGPEVRQSDEKGMSGTGAGRVCGAPRDSQSEEPVSCRQLCKKHLEL